MNPDAVPLFPPADRAAPGRGRGERSSAAADSAETSPSTQPLTNFLAAGDFDAWLATVTASLEGRGESAVPCGDCNACCRASYFIALTPDDTEARARIPAELIFPAPAAPVGHDLMPYDERGACPMLADGACGIYRQRPFTCRQYDCRVFAATEIAEPGAAKAEVMDRARRWRFDYGSDTARARQRALAAGAALLCRQDAGGIDAALPGTATQLALLAVRLLPVFEALGVPRLEDPDPALRQTLAEAIAAVYDP